MINNPQFSLRYHSDSFMHEPFVKHVWHVFPLIAYNVVTFDDVQCGPVEPAYRVYILAIVACNGTQRAPRSVHRRHADPKLRMQVKSIKGLEWVIATYFSTEARYCFPS
jgi:hypothetical protein